MIMIQPKRYKKKAILMRVDNEAVCAIVRKKSACLERKDLQQLIRLICEAGVKYQFYFWIKWISTKDNIRADKLSRGAPNPLETCNERTLHNKDAKAMKYAIKGIEEYKKARKRMQRHNLLHKRCECENVDLCEDQPLYPPWKHLN